MLTVKADDIAYSITEDTGFVFAAVKVPDKPIISFTPSDFGAIVTRDDLSDGIIIKNEELKKAWKIPCVEVPYEQD